MYGINVTFLHRVIRRTKEEDGEVKEEEEIFEEYWGGHWEGNEVCKYFSSQSSLFVHLPSHKQVSCSYYCQQDQLLQPSNTYKFWVFWNFSFSCSSSCSRVLLPQVVFFALIYTLHISLTGDKCPKKKPWKLSGYAV